MTQLQTPLLSEQAPTEWMEQAACSGYEDQNKFFPERNESQDIAKSVCARCPVTAECLDYAIRHSIDHGVWGGLSVGERRKRRNR